MTVRLRILNLLRSSPPLLASQIAWKLGLKLEVVSTHLGLLRRDGLTAKQKVFHPTAAYRFGYQIIRISRVFWTTADRRHELRGRLLVDTPHTTRFLRTSRRAIPFTGDMVQMMEDIRHATSQ